MLLSLVAIIGLIYYISLVYSLLKNLNFFLFLYCNFRFKRLFALSFLLVLN